MLAEVLLDIDYGKLIQSDIHNKIYWVVATEAAMVTGRKKAARGIRKELNLASAHSGQLGRDLESLMLRKRLNFVTGRLHSHKATRGARIRGSSRSRGVVWSTLLPNAS